MDTLITSLIGLLHSYSYGEIVLLFIIIFGLYIIYLKITDGDYYSDVQDIKSKYKARMLEYISGKLRIIEAISLNKTEEILGIKEGEVISEEVNRQFTMFGLVLEITMHHIIFESIKTAIRVNGFLNMNDDDLNVYIQEKSEVLLRESRKSINSKISYYPLLRGTDEKRFTIINARTIFAQIVNQCIKLHKEEHADIDKLKRQYSIWAKFNIFAKITNKR